MFLRLLEVDSISALLRLLLALLGVRERILVEGCLVLGLEGLFLTVSSFYVLTLGGGFTDVCLLVKCFPQD